MAPRVVFFPVCVNTGFPVTPETSFFVVVGAVSVANKGNNM